MKNSEMLQQIRDNIGTKEYGTQFICNMLTHPGRFPIREALDLRYWVSDLVYMPAGVYPHTDCGYWRPSPASTLESWLERNGHAYLSYEDKHFDDRMLVTRKAWLDWMISYWKEKGQ